MFTTNSISPFAYVLIVLFGTIDSAYGQSSSNKDRALDLYIAGTTLQLQGSRHAEAILEFQESLKHDTTAATLVAMSRSFVELRKLSQAYAHIFRATQLDPNSKDAWELLAEVLISEGRYDEGVKAYENIHELNPTKAQLYTLGKLYEPRSATKAIAIFEELVTREPDLGVYQTLAELYQRTKDMPNTIRTLKRAYALNPNNFSVVETYVLTLLSEGEIDTALSVAKSCLSSSNYQEARDRVWYAVLNSLYTDTLLAFVYRDQTIECVDFTAEHFNTSWQLTSMAGAIALLCNDHFRAANLFSLSVNSNPKSVELRLSIGTACIDNELYPYAIQLLSESMSLFPNNAIIPLELGYCFHKMNDLENALAYYIQATKIDPEFAEAWTRAGIIYESHRNYEAADHAFETALSIDDTNPLLCNNYAYSLAERNIQLDRARSLGWKAVQQSPGNASYLDTYAWILFKLGELEAAQKFIEKAVLYGGNAVHFEHQGDILEQLGELDGAVRSWKKSLELNPNNIEVKFKIDKYR